MTKTAFATKLKSLQQRHTALLRRKNRPQKDGNGIFDRHENPVLTAAHTPLEWRYDFNHARNPHLMTRLGINCVFNVGAMEFDNRIVLMARVEGWDRKSFFAVAESKNGVDNFRFRNFPVRMHWDLELYSQKSPAVEYGGPAQPAGPAGPPALPSPPARSRGPAHRLG